MLKRCLELWSLAWHLLIWKSFHKHLKSHRNVNMVASAWYVQMWAHQWFEREILLSLFLRFSDIRASCFWSLECSHIWPDLSSVSVSQVRRGSRGFVLSTISGRLWRLSRRPRRTVCRRGCCPQWPREICPDCCSFWPTAPRTRSTPHRPGRAQRLAPPSTLPVSWETSSWPSCSSGCVLMCRYCTFHSTASVWQLELLFSRHPCSVKTTYVQIWWFLFEFELNNMIWILDMNSSEKGMCNSKYPRITTRLCVVVSSFFDESSVWLNWSVQVIKFSGNTNKEERFSSWFWS